MTRTLAFWPAPRQGKSPQVRSTGPPRCARHRATQARIAARRRYNVSAAPPKAAAPREIARFRAPLSRASLLRSHSRGGAPRIKKRELWFRSSALAWPISCVPSNPTHDFDPHAVLWRSYRASLRECATCTESAHGLFSNGVADSLLHRPTSGSQEPHHEILRSLARVADSSLSCLQWSL